MGQGNQLMSHDFFARHLDPLRRIYIKFFVTFIK
jgi:hypothetical protein